MITMQVKIKRKHTRGLDPRAVHAAVLSGLASAALQGVGVVKNATLRAPPASKNGGKGAVNTGAFLQAWSSQTTRSGARIFNSASYAAVVEYGRRPGATMPPIAPLQQWVLRKLAKKVGITKLLGKTAGRARGAGGADVRLAAAHGIALSIARAIKHRGLKGRGITHSALPMLARIAKHDVLHNLQILAALP